MREQHIQLETLRSRTRDLENLVIETFCLTVGSGIERKTYLRLMRVVCAALRDVTTIAKNLPGDNLVCEPGYIYCESLGMCIKTNRPCPHSYEHEACIQWIDEELKSA